MKLYKISQFYLKRSRREQIIIFMFFVLLIILLWTRFVLYPLLEVREQYAEKVMAGNLEMKKLDEQMSAVIKNIKSAPTGVLKQTLAELQKKSESLSHQTSPFIGTHTTGKQFLVMLQSLILNQKGLSFISLQTTPPVPETSQVIVDPSISMLREGVVLTFSGSFIDTLAYLRQLKNIRWAWEVDELEFKLTGYPQGYVTLKMHILERQQ